MQATTPPDDFGFGEVTGSSSEQSTEITPDGEPARTSRLGGTLLISGLAVFVAALVIWLVARDSDDPGSETATTGTTTGEASATATTGPTGPTGAEDFVSAGILALDAADGGNGAGQIEFFVSPQALAFNVIAEDLRATTKNEAYAIWLTGGKTDHFLGFADVVDESGVLQASGPRPEDATKLPKWLGTAKQMVISRETANPGQSPATTVLQGAIADIAEPGGANAGAATPAP